MNTDGTILYKPRMAVRPIRDGDRPISQFFVEPILGNEGLKPTGHGVHAFPVQGREGIPHFDVDVRDGFLVAVPIDEGDDIADGSQ